MLVNHAGSVSQALHNGLHALRVHGIPKASRVGDVLTMPRPVMTEYSDPTNRVLFSPMRDANPFFHVMETLWMLAGRNDLPWLTRFNKRFESYSDDGGKTQPGAYGYRWRNYFGHDQIQDAILELKQNPDSRRVVIAMWDPGHAGIPGHSVAVGSFGDFGAAVSGSADVPCNTHIYFDTIDGRLNMTVCCRSNDILWGAYGANAVHFSFLLEYMSAHTGIPMGVYRQFSNNFHLYTNILSRDMIMPMARDVEASDRYLVKQGNSLIPTPPAVPLRKVPLVTDPEYFDKELMDFNWTEGRLKVGDFSEPFFRGVAVPLYNAYMYKKDRNYDDALETTNYIIADDWRIAAQEWMRRKQIAHERNTKPFTEVVETNTFNQDHDVADTFGVERSTDA
jgi:hypothetical protein